MSYTLVSAGTVVSGVSVLTMTATCTSTTAGNLLVCGFAGGVNASNVVTFPAGWVKAVALLQSNLSEADIWYYPNCPAGITSAVINWSGGQAAAAQILEFHDAAGSNTSPVDVTGTVAGSATPRPIATGSATTASGDLAVAVSSGVYASATKDTLAAGSGFTQGGNYGNGVKQTVHTGFDYELATGAAGVITDSVAFTGPFNTFAGAIATFQVFTAAPAGLLSQQLKMRHPALWTRITHPGAGAVYTR